MRIGAMFQLLLSADLLLDDADLGAHQLTERLGLPASRPSWRQSFAGHGFVANWLRVHPSLAVAPTRLETISLTEGDATADPLFADYVRSLIAFQGRHRPQKSHGTVLVTSDLPSVIEMLARLRVPFRLAPWSDAMAFDRVWTGVTPEDPRYRPAADGGLMLELLPLEALGLPAEVFAETPPAPTDPAPEELLRITRRSHLVRDLDASVRALARLGLEPAEPVRADDVARRAIYRFAIGHGAALELLGPRDAASLAGRYLAMWGPGPFTTTIAVQELDAKRADLERRGTRTVLRHDDDGPVLAVHPDDLGGARVELTGL
jgi:hypothetical protein